MTRWLELLLLSTLTLSPASPQAIASDWSQQLDGVVNAHELEGAAVHEIPGGELFLRRSGQILDVAIRTSPLSVASLCLAAGNEVHVLHASAALGAVTYRRRDATYVSSENFEWGMREQGMDEQTQSLRQRYFADHGWVASTMRMGTRGQVEMRIDLDRLPPGPVHVALGLMSEDGSVSGWPRERAGECANQGLVSGSPPASLEFSPDNWPRVPDVD